MKNIILALVTFLIIGTIPAYAKNDTFDIFSYKAPAGYVQNSSKPGMMIYSKMEGDKFCMIGIYQSRQSSGNSEQDFNNEWNALVAKPLGTGNGKVIEETKYNGWDVLLKADKAKSEELGEFYVTLTSFSGHGRVSSVIINYNDGPMFEQDIDDFLKYFDTVQGFPTGQDK